MSTKKEILKSNKPRDTVFVGVGGIGSKIVTRLAERCNDEEAQTLRFVSMDTDVNDLKQVKTAKSNVTAIQTSSTQSVGDYLEKDDDARLNWFPNNTILYPKTVSEGAGQVRAISRLALDTTVKSGEVLKLYKAIDSLFNKDGRDLKQALNVVIVSTASGGTGSGIAMIVAMLVRKYLEKQYPETRPWIRGYIVLPGVMDTVISTETERESLRRNGYATIKEINAFMMMGSGFFGTEKALARYSDLSVKVPTTAGVYETLNSLPFDFCFLLDRVDANQGNMQNLDDYLDFAAQSLYELSVGPMQKATSSQEDNIIKEIAKKGNFGRNRFAGAGAAVLRYPYEDVVDYVAFSRAIDKIGQNEEKSWLRYDIKFKEKYAEFKKRREMEGDLEEPKIEVLYPELLNDEKDDSAFGKEIRTSYLMGRDEDSLQTSRTRVEDQLAALKNAILDELDNIPSFMAYSKLVKTFKSGEVFSVADSQNRGSASAKRDDLEAFYDMISKNVSKKARGICESVFRNEKALAGNFDEFHIEKLLKNSDGGIHPNAMRFNLYVLKALMQERKEQIDISSLNRRINDFIQGEGDVVDFEVKGRGIFKGKEDSLDTLCTLDAANDDPNLLQRWGGYDNLYKKLDEVFSGLSSSLDKLLNGTIEAAIYEIGLPYVSDLCKEFERFYETFTSKVIKLNDKKANIVEDLNFTNGSVVLNVCCSEKHLDQLEKRAPQGRLGLLLPGELNGNLFDAVKKNVAARKERALDKYSESKTIDLFDDILIDFFRDTIREDCNDVINMNVIEAIRKEYAFNEYEKAHFHNENNEDEIEVEYSDMDRDAHVRSRILKCRALASPGIIMRKFEEARKIETIACNESVEETLREYGDDMGRVAPSDTVSRYELRFFNAEYNITPNKLAKFSAPSLCEVNMKDAGLYYTSYHEYIKDIGPDSTKSMTISLHVDKRWDSIAELPELDMDTQREEFLRIHSALIYGFVHGAIKPQVLSQYDKEKTVYELENLDGEFLPLIVSNGSECDEFYEILDALYRDRASVELIYKISEDRRKYDVEKSHVFDDTTFADDLKQFSIGDWHQTDVSLFEIPLMHYNSLPKRFHDENELLSMIDAVIQVLCHEITLYEKGKDIGPNLCRKLDDQFRLLVENFVKYEKLSEGSSLKNNPVITMLLQRLHREFELRQVSNWEEKVNTFKKLADRKKDV